MYIWCMCVRACHERGCAFVSVRVNTAIAIFLLVDSLSVFMSWGLCFHDTNKRKNTFKFSWDVPSYSFATLYCHHKSLQFFVLFKRTERSNVFHLSITFCLICYKQFSETSIIKLSTIAGIDERFCSFKILSSNIYEQTHNPDLLTNKYIKIVTSLNDLNIDHKVNLIDLYRVFNWIVWLK